MNQITTRQTSRSPSTTTNFRVTELAPLTGADLTRLQRLSNALEKTIDGRWQMPETALPAPGERQWLTDRDAALQRSLMRANRDAISSVVAAMFLRFPPAGPTNEREGKIAAYVEDLQAFPLWAIERAAASVKGPYAPASNVLCAAVRDVLAPTVDERAKVLRLLTADVYHVPDEDERARVSAKMDALLADLRLNVELDNPKAKPTPYASPNNSRQQAQDWLNEQQKATDAPVRLSDAALRSVGASTAEKAA